MSQFLIGKVELKFLAADIVRKNAIKYRSQFLIGKVEQKQLEVEYHKAYVKEKSQFLIGKVERTKPRQGIA